MYKTIDDCLLSWLYWYNRIYTTNGAYKLTRDTHLMQQFIYYYK